MVHSSLPIASTRTFSSSPADLSVWYGGLVEEGAERSDGKGTERELGIWPDESPARGSGEVPSKLQMRERVNSTAYGT